MPRPRRATCRTRTARGSRALFLGETLRPVERCVPRGPRTSLIEDVASAGTCGPDRARGPIRTLAVLNSFIGGGAERQMMHLLNHLDRARFDLSLCVLAAEGPLAAEVPSDVRL